jgi:hypothetical protein
MLRVIAVFLIFMFLCVLNGFSEPEEIDTNLNGELVINYEKNVKLVEGKLWILYYDASLYPGTTYLKMAVENNEGSFDIHTLSTMWIDHSARYLLDCTFCVTGEVVVVFFQKTSYNITDLKVYKLRSVNSLASFNTIEFSSQYGNIADMDLQYADSEIILTLLRKDPYNSIGIQNLFYYNRNGQVFNGQDTFDGPVYSKDHIYIRNTMSGSNNGWPLFNDMVVSEGRIIDDSTGQPAIYTVPMDDIFQGGYVENANSNFDFGFAGNFFHAGYTLNASLDRDVLYMKIDGSVIMCRYGDYVSDTRDFTVYNSFPDNEHTEISIGDSIWTNEVEIREMDWDDNTFALSVQSSMVGAYCDIWIEGSVAGSMSIASQENIYITGDLTYWDITPGQDPVYSSSYLGLYSDKSIYIKYKHIDPVTQEIVTNNCDDIYIYGVLAAMGNSYYEWDAGSLKVEYLHPHGSTPQYEVLLPDSKREIFTYPDLNKFVYSDANYFTGDPGFIMHSNNKPAGYPCCGFPYEDPQYGDGICTPYGTDFPFYNPVYPESSEDIVFDRGTLHFYGALYERSLHKMRCNGQEGNIHHYTAIWNPDENAFGGSHDPCGYDLDFNFDLRLQYQNQHPPFRYYLMGANSHRITILHSSNAGNTFVQRHDHLEGNEGLAFTNQMHTTSENNEIAFIYQTPYSFKLARYNSLSYSYNVHNLPYEDFYGDIRSLRMFEGDLYFQDDINIYLMDDNYHYEIADLSQNDYYGFFYKNSYRLMWEAEWVYSDLDFCFYEFDNNWYPTEAGDSTLEQNIAVNQYNLENFYFNCTETGEAQLLLYTSSYNNNKFYLSRAIISGVPNDETEVISPSPNLQAYPNPLFLANGRAHTLAVSYSVPLKQSGVLRLYNIRGQCLQEWQITGSGEVIFNAENSSSGIYLLQLQTEESSMYKKFSIIK